jgi:hypothetical protein
MKWIRISVQDKDIKLLMSDDLDIVTALGLVNYARDSVSAMAINQVMTTGVTRKVDDGDEEANHI